MDYGICILPIRYSPALRYPHKRPDHLLGLLGVPVVLTWYTVVRFRSSATYRFCIRVGRVVDQDVGIEIVVFHKEFQPGVGSSVRDIVLSVGSRFRTMIVFRVVMGRILPLPITHRISAIARPL